MPLESLYLQIASMNLGPAGGDARSFLAKALEPPTPTAVDAAVRSLRRI